MKERSEMIDKVEMIALGVGSAFTMKDYQTNFVIRVTNDSVAHNLLFDFGTDLRWSLHGQGMSYLDIEGIYCSHGHNDHAASIDYLAFPTYFDPRYKAKYGYKPFLFAERNLMRDLWDHSWRGSLESLEGIDATLDTYFTTCPVEKNKSFNFAEVDFNIVQSVHVSAKYSIVDTYGLMFTDPVNKKRVYMSSDVQFSPENSMKAYYKEADVIFHDCETAPYKSGVHSHYTDLKTLPADTKKKMRLVHYQDNVLDNWEEWSKKAIDDGFHGFAQKGIVYSSEE
jgi:ribonuclease BN (tRNA processing enzyme)